LITIHKLEFWADSFHEGDWASLGLSTFFSLIKTEFIEGFIPKYTFQLNDDNLLEVTVFGSYKNWSPLPPPISELLDWGKPDLIIFDPLANRILLAVEETAATPTGNQALQRCERIYGSSRSGIPFWYLLSEFGRHIDGGVRRDSIWPTVLALKLSCMNRTPSMVIHYSDVAHPEDYGAGEGYAQLFNALSAYIKVWATIDDVSIIEPILTEQYQHMLDFVSSQWKNVTNFIPGLSEVDEHTAADISKHIMNGDKISELRFLNYLNWPTTDQIPKEVYDAISPSGIIKPDVFVNYLESLVQNKTAYNLSGGAGSKPQPRSSIETWAAQQQKIFTKGNTTDAVFSMDVSDFPVSAAGNLHVTTAKNVCYLANSWTEVKGSLIKAYPRLTAVLDDTRDDDPVLVYLSNSITPGRIFGDPFTGQLTAFSNIFAKNLIGDKTRIVVAYYPHQSHTQLFDARGNMRTNKGITLMRELVDIAIFHGGVAVDFATMRIL